MNASRLLLLFTVLVAALHATSPARADEPSITTTEVTARPSLEPVSGHTWYGWQTLAVDTAAFGIMAGGLSGNSGAAFGSGFALYSLGPPIVHAAHGRWEVAAGDMVLRAGAPFLLAFIGAKLAPSSCRGGVGSCAEGPVDGAIYGALIGYAGSILVDAAILAHDPSPKTAPAARGFQWAPAVAVTPKGARAGVGGVF